LDATAGTLRTRREDRLEIAIAALAFLAVVATFALRVIAARNQPLTMDETFTGMIVSQHSLADFIREARRDIAAPLYYSLMWLLPLNDSDFAMRLPSWAFMIIGSALPLMWRIPGQSRSAAIGWAALLYLWLPGTIFSVQARPYALLFLVATAQTIAFARLIEVPTLRRAFSWTACSSLTLLTHYFAAPLALAQGLILLAVLGKRALPLWPSLLLVLIPTIETITHYRQLAFFATSDANWLPPITFANLHDYLSYGLGTLGPVLLLIALGSRYFDRSEAIPRGAALASIAGAVALGILILAGWHRSLLVDRYLTACAPALMLAVITVAAGIGARILIVAVASALAIYAAAGVPLRIREQSMEWSAEKIIPFRPAHLVYSLGYSGQQGLKPETRRELGEFLFRRAGVTAQARMVTTLDGRELIRAAGDDAAVIWVFYPRWQPLANAIARERHCFIAPRQLACPPLHFAKR
jgi:hypothetical protein